MTCQACQENAVIILPENSKKLCKTHFLSYFETKVYRTISRYHLLGKKENILVAVSGGKDSLTALYLLHKIAQKNKNYKVTALLIDEGIAGYRPSTIEDAKLFCQQYEIPLEITSFKDLSGF